MSHGTGAIYQAGEDVWLVIWHLIKVSAIQNWEHQGKNQAEVSFHVLLINAEPDFSLKPPNLS